MRTTNINKKIKAIDNTKAMYDAACKVLLKEKQIMAHLLKECVEEFADCSIEDIVKYAFTGKMHVGSYPVDANSATPEIENDDTEDIVLDEGQVRYDLRFTVTVPHSDEKVALIVNVEAQHVHHKKYEFVTRAIYYCARMISAQKNTVFTVDDYQKIRKVYSIWLCMNPPNKEQDSITRYDITEKTVLGNVTRPRKSFDLISIVMLYLGKAYREDYNNVIGLFSSLFSSQMADEEKINVLTEKYGFAVSEELERRLNTMCNLSMGVEEIGIQKGFQKGIQEGVQEGIFISVVKLMDNLGFTMEQAMNALEIPEDDKPEYEELLKKKK